MKQHISALAFIAIIFIFSCTQDNSNAPKHTPNSAYTKAYTYLEQEKPDSAFLYFSKTIAEQKDSLISAKAYFNMAVIQANSGDYFGCEESAIKALEYLKPGSEFIPGLYNTIAISRANSKDYRSAENWYKDAIASCNITENCLLYQNNLAITLTEQEKFKEAIILLEELSTNKTLKKDTVKYAKVLDNLAWTRWKQNPKTDVYIDLNNALEIRKQVNDKWGMNASFAHLSDYYANTKPNLALNYAKLMYVNAQQIESPADRLQALQKLIKLSNGETAKKHFDTYQTLNDSLITAQNTAKNQFALIKYETEKHKAEKQTLALENSRKQYYIITLFVVAFAIVSGIIFWYKKRQEQLKLDAENNLKAQQLKTSKKVHDVVANGLYRVMSEIENEKEINKEHLLDEIEALYEKSRDISYEYKNEPIINFHERLGTLLKSFATSQIKILLVNNTETIWCNASNLAKQEIENILQELMVNMKKHSKAQNVVLKFENIDNKINITYTDDGIGLKQNTKFNNGLTNTGNRINTINGSITFDTELEKGLKIYITFPTP